MVKMPKDPNAPRRPMSTYMMWSNASRPRVTSANPDASMVEIAKLMGDMWKEVSDKEKEPFKRKSEIQKRQYEKDIAKYKKTDMFQTYLVSKEEFKKKANRKQFKKDLNAPKRPLSSYMFFVTETRNKVVAENPTMKQADILRQLGKMWKGLSSNAQAPYVVKASDAKVKYEAQMAKYKKSTNYKKYMAEKNEYDAMMKARREKAKPKPVKKAKKAMKPAKKKVSRSKSRSKSKSRRRSRVPKSPSRKSRSRSGRRGSIKKKARRVTARKANAPKSPKHVSSSRSRSRSKPKRKAVSKPKGKRKSSGRRAVKRRAAVPRAGRAPRRAAKRRSAA